MVSLPSMQFAVKADLSGLKSVGRELIGLGNQGKTTGQAISEALKKSASESASAFRDAGLKGGGDFGEQFSRGADGKIRDSMGRFVGSAKTAGGDAGKGFSAAFKGAIGNVFQGMAQGIGQQLTSGIASALGGLKGLAIDREAIASYDKARAQVSTLTNDMAGMARMAQEVSKAVDGSASQTEVLAASYDVLSAGFSEAADAASILTNAQKGAIGGMSDLNTVSNATTTILNAYGLAAKDADKVVNQMIGTQNAGKIVVGEYASKIGAVATTAAQAGVPLEELNAFIATATVKGVAANSSIDGMRAAISAVLKPSQEASEYAAQLGVNFSAAGLRANGLSGILSQLRDRNADSADSLVRLFGSVEAVAAIIPSAGDGMADFAKNLETIKGASAEDAFQKMENSIEGLSKKNAVLREELALKFQIATAPLFEAANNGLTMMLQSLNEGGVLFEGLNQAAMGFRDFLAQNPEIITTITAAFAELLNGGVLLLQDGIVGFTEALRENPQLIQDMAGGLVNAVQMGLQFAQGMSAALGAIMDMAEPIIKLVAGTGEAKKGADGMASAFGQVVVFGAVLMPIVGIFSTIFSIGSTIVTMFGGWATIGTTISGIFSGIAGIFPPLILGVTAVAIWIENIKNYSAEWDNVVLGIQQTWQDLTGFIGGVFDAIGQTIGQSEIFQNIWGAIVKVVEFLIKPYKDIFNWIGQTIQKSEFFQGIWTGLKGIIDGIGNAFRSVVGSALDGLIQKAQQLFGWLKGMAGFGGGNGGGQASLNIAGINDVQKKNAAAIAQEGKARGLNNNQIAAIIAGAMQESQLGTMNDEVGGYGGKGLFQLTDEPGKTGTWIGKGGIKSVQDYYDPNKNVKAIMEDYRFDEWKKASVNQSPEEAATSFAKIVLRPQTVGDKYADKARKLFPGGNTASAIQFSEGGGSTAGTGEIDKSNAGKVIVNRTGQKDDKGLEVLSVRTFDKSGKNVAQFTANSGLPGQQGNFGQRARDEAMTGNPLPYGDYGIGPTVTAPANPGYGKFTTIMDPKFATARSGIEAHVDGNRQSSPGSMGCLVFKTEKEFSDFMASVRQSGADTIRFEEAKTSGGFQMPAMPSMTESFAAGNAKSAGGGAIDNTVANKKADKNAENQAMTQAVEAARKREDAATKLKREDAARQLKQSREESKLKLEGDKAGLVTPEAREASDRALKQLEIRAQYEDRLLDLEQKRDDLMKARDRKKTDLASKDVAVAAAAKALPDFSAQIASYDALIAKDKELQASALKNLTIGEESKQAELDRTAAIARRNAEQEKALEFEKSERQLAIERAGRTDPLLAKQLEYAGQRKDLQVALNKEIQEELDKLADIERKMAELAKAGQSNSPEIKRLQLDRNTANMRIGDMQATAKNRMTGLDEAQAVTMGKARRDRNAALLEKDSMMAEGGIAARKASGKRMRDAGNVTGANEIEKEAALMELSLQTRQKHLALEARIADMRAKGVEVSESEAQTMRDQVDALASVDLTNITSQFDTFQQEIMPTIQSSLGGFFKTLMDGSKSVGEAFSDMIGNITSKIFDFAANQIVSSLLGGAFGGAGAGGGKGIGGFFGKIFGFSDGGIVGAGDVGNLRSIPAIDEALRKEGPTGVLAALQKGEMVLTQPQAKAFIDHPMANEILNFNRGGIVGRPGSPIASSQSAAPSAASNVNIALNVTGGGSEVDYGMVARVAQRAATSEISRQQKPRGSLSR